MAAGAYFAAFLVERFTGKGNGHLLRLSTYLGIPLAVVGVILLIIELGQPIRFWHLLTTFKVISPMSMGTWILLAWVGIAVIMAVFWWAEPRLNEGVNQRLKQITKVLAPVNAAFSVLLMAYTGVLLAASNLPLWQGTVLLPALFVASAISTGVALLVITAVTGRAWSIPNWIVGRLAEADAIVILVELVILIGYTIWLAASSLAGAGEVLRLLTTGILAAPFWLGVVLLALLVPLWLEVTSWGKKITTKSVWRTIVASSTCVILGGLILRALIVIGGQL
jgi:polysulfide reductase chain C